MTFRVVSACLLVLVLVPPSLGTKDPWDDPSEQDQSQGQAAVPQEMGDEMPAEENQITPDIMQRVAARSAERRAHNKHQVMKDFMKSFANNMRLSVLEDSRGDMPEAQRQALIAKAEAQKQELAGQPMFGGGGDAEGASQSSRARDEEAGGDDIPPPQPRPMRMRPRRHMMNMAQARHQRMHRRAPRLLPEAEGLGFPPPEGMAEDPATEGMANNPGMAMDQSFDEQAPQRLQRRTRHAPRHHLRMLNARPGLVSKAHRHRERAADAHRSPPQLPPGVVRDEMGRPMALLFTAPVHSGVHNAVCAPLAVAAVACFFATFW